MNPGISSTSLLSHISCMSPFVSYVLYLECLICPVSVKSYMSCLSQSCLQTDFSQAASKNVQISSDVKVTIRMSPVRYWLYFELCSYDATVSNWVLDWLGPGPGGSLTWRWLWHTAEPAARRLTGLQMTGLLSAVHTGWSGCWRAETHSQQLQLREIDYCWSVSYGFIWGYLEKDGPCVSKLLVQEMLQLAASYLYTFKNTHDH